MAGFRDFQTGEVLTSANVNDFLAKQAVMKFADATARDTALGTAVGGSNALREGMVVYLDDTNEVLKYDGTAWDSVVPVVAGIGTNVEQSILDTTVSSTSTSWTDIGLSVSITPTTATSKVLVIASVVQDASGPANRGALTLTDGSNNELFVPDTPGNRTPIGGGIVNEHMDAFMVHPFTMIVLHSPATTSSTTYKVRGRTTSGGTWYINRASDDGNSSDHVRTVSTIMAIEVAA